MKKRLAVLVLAFAMVLTMSASVFAAGDGANSGKNTGADSYAAGTAMLVKYAQIPEGVDLTKDAMANKTFTFTFEAADPTAPATTNNYAVPKADFQAKNFSVTTDKLSVTTAWASAGVTDTQNMVWKKSIAEIFSDVDGQGTAFVFPRAGEYTFKVKETAGAANDKWTYASDEYTLRLVVKNDPTTTDPNNKTITDVTVQNKDGQKVDPSKDDPQNNPDDSTTDVTEPAPSNSNGGFTFTNLYKPTVDKHDEPQIKNPDEDPATPSNPDDIIKTDPKKNVNGAFELDKYVLGAYGDRTKGFVFPVTVTLPASDPSFNVVASGNVTGGTLTKDASNSKVYSGNITLKHGESFVITELPVGTKISVKEGSEDATKYTQLMDTKDVNEGPATTAVTVLITEDGGYAICRNSFDDNSITPTGIIINNLPYVLLIGIALGGIVLFSRKRRYE